jgi:hypothetical protein
MITSSKTYMSSGLMREERLICARTRAINSFGLKGSVR